MTARPRAIGLLVIMVLACVVSACSGGPAAPTLPGGAPGAAELGNAPVCEAIEMLSVGLVKVRDVRLRRTSRKRLEQAWQSLLTGYETLLARVPADMDRRIRTFGLAVTNLSLAVEDFRTTDQITDAAANVRKRSSALAKAVRGLREYARCVAPAAGPAASPR